MPQNIKEEIESENVEEFEKLVAPQTSPWKHELLYQNIALALFVHLAALYGFYYFLGSAKWSSILFMLFCGNAGIFGALGGAHRLWSHRSYKASLPLQILLVLCYDTTLSPSIIFWVQNHRRHHKFSDTDGDPHNSTRGFFFSHIGWVLVRRHPEAAKRRKCVDISDVLNDPILKFEKKYLVIMMTLFSIILPVTVMMCFGESFLLSWCLNMLRIALVWHSLFAINSFAHLWGNKPYDKTKQPRQNHFVSFVALGEGFHNYHHTFPWDYRAAELGNNWLNVSSLLIDFFALIGWAYDLKTVPAEMIESRKKRTGDGTDSWGFDTTPVT